MRICQLDENGRKKVRFLSSKSEEKKLLVDCQISSSSRFLSNYEAQRKRKLIGYHRRNIVSELTKQLFFGEHFKNSTHSTLKSDDRRISCDTSHITHGGKVIWGCLPHSRCEMVKEVENLIITNPKRSRLESSLATRLDTQREKFSMWCGDYITARSWIDVIWYSG